MLLSLLVAAVSAALGWERLGSRRWIGVGLGVVGVIVTLSDRVGRPPSIAALLWVLLGLAALTGGTLLHSRVRTTAGPSTQGVVEVAASAVVMAAWAPPKGSLAIPLTFQGVGSFLWLALIVGAGSPLLLFALIRQRGATRASSLLFIVPAVTAFASWPILGTAVGIVTVAGLVIVGIGLWLARPKMEQPAPTKPAEAEAEEELFPL